tara:strand:+ start:306 stop:581 length:276 start_codon:yes stop_codon:yes gene_type:complete
MEMTVDEVSKTVETPQTQEPTTATGQAQQKQVLLKDLKVNTENDALNYMVGFLELAHRRGVFTLEEAAKINECVAKFRRTPQVTETSETSQ